VLYYYKGIDFMKLTNVIKESLIKKACDTLFKEKSENLKISFSKACEIILIKRGERLAESIPDEWSKYIIASSSVLVRRKDASDIRVSLKKQFASKYSGIELIEENNELLTDILKEYDTIIKNIEEFNYNAKLLLKQCNTSNQLKELSPELFDFLPDDQLAARNDLISIDIVNKVNSYFISFI
jgi:hypothetical protein